MISKRLIKSGLLLVVALLVALPIIGCGPEETAPLPVEKAIKIGSLPDLTGYYSGSVSDIYRGMSDYIRWINEAKDGIDGAKVKFLWGDIRADAAIAITTYKRLKEKEVVAFLTYTSLENTAIRAFIGPDKMPTVGTGASPSLSSPPGYYFHGYGTTPQISILTTEWYYSQFKKKGLDRPMRLATLGWSNVFGKEGLEPVINWAKGQEGIEIVSTVWTSPSALDFTTELLVTKDKTPDLIWGVGGAGLAARDAAKVGLSRDVTMIWESGTGATKAAVDLAGPEITRLTTNYMFWSWGEDKPLITQIKDLQMQYHGDIVESDVYLAGWNCASLICEAAGIAINRVGYENLTGEAIKEALESINDFDNGTGMPVGFADYPGDRTACEDLRMVRYDLEKSYWTPLSDWLHGTPIPELEPYFE